MSSVQLRESETITVLRRHLVQFLPTWQRPTHYLKPPRLGPKPASCIVETLRRDSLGAMPGYEVSYGYRFVWENEPLDIHHFRAHDNVYEDWWGDLEGRTDEEKMRYCEDAARERFITWPIESWRRVP